MKYAALVVADDLTGAMDTGSEFARRGHRTTVALGATVCDRDAAVAVVDTESRYLPAEEAASAVADAVREHPSDDVYKKVDSTLRGNLVAEVDAVVGATGADLAVVAPAFPANGRTTEDGVHRANGMPVTETDAGNDPDKPAPAAHLPTLFEASEYPAVHLPIACASEGAVAVAGALSEFADRHGTAVVVCDAVRAEHLAGIAAGAADTELDIAYVGSAGLARHVDVSTGGGANEAPAARRDPADGPNRVLGIAGSTNPTTVEQVAAIPEGDRIDLDLRRSVLDSRAAANDAAERSVDLLRGGGTALVTTVGADSEAALRTGRKHGVPEREVRERISRTLGLAARRVHEAVGVTGLFLTGGAVAVDVLDALGADGIELTGEEVGAGIPLGRAGGGAADGASVVTKAGAFGGPGTIPNCLDSLRHDDE